MSRECKHFDKHCWKVIFSGVDEYTLCQKCFDEPLFSKSEFLTSKIQFIRTPDEIIESLTLKIEDHQSGIKSLEKMIRKQEKLKDN